MQARPITLSIAITGSSGVGIALYMLRKINDLSDRVKVKGIIITEAAIAVARYEEEMGEEELIRELSKYSEVYRDNDFTSPLASSSNQPDAMAIVPASVKTIGLIANGIPETLVSRAALAILRLGRRLVVAPRETPLGLIELRNLVKLAESGAIIVPMCIGLYTRPKTIEDIYDFITGKILDSIGIEHNIYKRWSQNR